MSDIAAIASQASTNAARSASAADDQTTTQPSSFAFSLAFASAALETQAAQSLEIHGGAPAGATNSFTGNTNAAAVNTPGSTGRASADSPLSADSGNPGRAGADVSNSQAPQSPLQTGAPSIKTEASPTRSEASISVSAAPAATILTTAPTTRTTTPALAARDGLARTSSSPSKALAPQNAPNTARNEAARQAEPLFAKIAARHANGASNFEIRLDPPELGRIDGRLSVQETGKSVLTLTFDNQSAFDLFRQDEAALRSLLENAGAHSGDAELQLSLNSSDLYNDQLHDPVETPAPEGGALIDTPITIPARLAFSSGAIDISI